MLLTTSLNLIFIENLFQTANFFRSQGWPLYTGLTVLQIGLSLEIVVLDVEVIYWLVAFSLYDNCILSIHLRFTTDCNLATWQRCKVVCYCSCACECPIVLDFRLIVIRPIFILSDSLPISIGVRCWSRLHFLLLHVVLGQQRQLQPIRSLRCLQSLIIAIIKYIYMFISFYDLD